MAELGSKFKHMLSDKNKKTREEKAVGRPSQGVIVDEPLPKKSLLDPASQDSASTTSS